MALHDNRAKLAFEEAIEFDKAIGRAISLTNLDETLIIVTADHSHAIDIVGYGSPPRSENILGKYLEKEWTLDDLPSTILTFANGPSATKNAPRLNISQDDTSKIFVFLLKFSS